MRNTIVILLLICLLGVLPMYAAETDTIYIKEGGSLTDAVAALDGSGGRIVLQGDVIVHNATILPEQSGDLTITADGGSLVLSADLTLAKNTNASTVTFDCPITINGERRIFGGFNSVTFTKNVSVSGTLDFYGGVDSGTNATLGVGDAAVEESNRQAITELPYAITVNGGSFRIFAGGNRRVNEKAVIGSIAAPLTVTVNGGTFGKGVSFAANDPLKIEQAFSLSGMSILADDATLTVNGGTFHVPIYAQGHLGETATYASGGSQITKSDRKYYAIDGEITLNLIGGSFDGCEINAFQNAAGYTQLLRGNYTVTIGENAVLAENLIIDATQVKAYTDGSAKASLSFPADKSVAYKRFDLVNGEAKTYDEPLRIACIGDSITEGNSSGSRQTMSYPAQLLTRLAGEGKDVLLGNYGCSGTRVLDYNKQYYMDMLAYTISTEEADADWVIIGLGTNDAGITQAGRSQLMRFYTEYMDLLTAYGSSPETEKVYATTAIYRPTEMGYGAISARAYQIKAVETLSKNSEKYVSVDLYALLLEDAIAGKLLGSDNLHPTKTGYTIYVDKLCDAIYNGKCTLDGFTSSDIYLSADGTTNIEATKENPTNSLMIAFAKAAPTTTLHIIGTYTATLSDSNRCLATPPIEHLTIQGESEDAALLTNAKFFLAESDILLHNFLLSTTSSGAIMIQLGYHNATLTEAFRTDPAHNPMITVGYTTFSPSKTATYYSTHEWVSADKDCAVQILGGTYAYILGGNYLYNTSSILGTYSGNLTLHIGSGVQFKEITHNAGYKLNGACGQNYLTGNITMQVDAWPKSASIRDYSLPGTSGEAATHDPTRNTGRISIQRGAGVDSEVIVTGDFNGDGKVDLADTLCLLQYNLRGNFDKSANFYGRETVTLLDVLRTMKMLAK